MFCNTPNVFLLSITSETYSPQKMV